MSKQDLLLKIDETLDNLIENAKVMKEPFLSELEILSFQKIQESLIARLMSLNSQTDKRELPSSIKVKKKLEEFIKSFNETFIIKNLPTTKPFNNKIRYVNKRVKVRRRVFLPLEKQIKLF